MSPKTHNRVNIFGGSPEIDWEYLEELKPSLTQNKENIAVDKGLEICHRLGLPITAIVGDFDSVSPEILNLYSNIPTISYPPEKDKSDLELAVDYAIKKKYEEIWLFNCTGGRLDHLMFNLFQLFVKPSKIFIADRFGTTRAIEPNKRHYFQFNYKTTFSLIPFGQCTGVTIRGAKYPLQKANLSKNSLTLSNEGTGTIEIEYSSGELLLFIEGKTKF